MFPNMQFLLKRFLFICSSDPLIQNVGFVYEYVLPVHNDNYKEGNVLINEFFLKFQKTVCFILMSWDSLNQILGS